MLIRRLVEGLAASEGTRFLAVTRDKLPPKTWLQNGAAHFAQQITSATYMKAIGVNTVPDYLRLPRTWLLLEVQAATAVEARDLVERALTGSDLAARRITTRVDRYGLLKGSKLEYRPPAPQAPSFTIGNQESRSARGVDREGGREVTPDRLDPAALFMGLYSQPGTDEVRPGLTLTQHYPKPFSISSVRPAKIGFADIPVIQVTGLAADHDFSTQIARPLAVGFAKQHGLVFDLFMPGVRGGRDRIAEDRNPGSPTFGKNKKMETLEVHFEVPREQLGRLTREQQSWFGSFPQSPAPAWGRREIEHWLGIDKVTRLPAASRPAAVHARPAPVQELFPPQESVPVAETPRFDPQQVASGKQWAYQKLRHAGRAIEMGTRKKAEARTERDRAFWHGVIQWGLENP